MDRREDRKSHSTDNRHDDYRTEYYDYAGRGLSDWTLIVGVVAFHAALMWMVR